MFFDPSFIIILPALIFAFYAQFKVKSTYDKYAKVNTRNGMSGAEAAKQIMENSGLNVKVEAQSGFLTDHYDPRDKTLRLSEGVYYGRTISALGVAAHEAGHAIQDKGGYLPMRFRASLVPTANIGSTMAFPLFFLGLFLRTPFLMTLGIVLFSFAVLFHVVTLPVEFNASKRALITLSDSGLLTKEEIDGSREVLNAAALTYVAATAMAALQLIRLLMIKGRRD